MVKYSKNILTQLHVLSKYLKQSQDNITTRCIDRLTRKTASLVPTMRTYRVSQSALISLCLGNTWPQYNIIVTLPYYQDHQKSHFSTVLLIETSDYYIISEETNRNCCTAAYLFTYCCLLLPIICV